MPSFSSNYVAPGVFVQYQDTAIPAAPAGTLIPVIIGLGKKTITYTETVVRGATTTTPKLDLLAKSNAFTVSSVTDRVGTAYVASPTMGYTLDTTNSALLWAGATLPAAASSYSVTYTYRKSSADYDPFLTTRMEDIESLYGQAIYTNNLLTGVIATATVNTVTATISGIVPNQYDGSYLKVTSGTGLGQERLIISTATTTTANVAVFTVEAWSATPTTTDVFEINDISTNTLSIGAKLAIQSGAGYIMVVQATDDIVGSDTGGTGWEGGIYKLRNQECYSIVLMKGMSSTSPTVMNYLKSHVISMSTLLEKRFRTAIIGAPINSTTTATYTGSAAALFSERIAYLCPSNMSLTLNSITKTVDGSYLAAAVVGIVCNPNYTWGEPISGKSIIPFDDIINPFVRSEMNLMAGTGTFVIEKRGAGDFRIRHALSTKNDTIVNQEFKVIRIKDALSKYLISSLESTYVNTRNIGPETLSNIKAFVKFMLGNVLSRQDITEYTDPDVRLSPLDPRQININFMIKPTWDLNYILVTFGVAL